MSHITNASKILAMAKILTEGAVRAGRPKTYMTEQLTYILKNKPAAPVKVSIDGKEYNISGIEDSSDGCVLLVANTD